SSSHGYVIYGAEVGDCVGLAVSGAGDMNGDGVDDVAVGVLRSNFMNQGGVLVVYGNRTASHSSSKAVHLGFEVIGPAWSLAGYSLSGAGDVNGDGLDDLLIG